MNNPTDSPTRLCDWCQEPFAVTPRMKDQRFCNREGEGRHRKLWWAREKRQALEMLAAAKTFMAEQQRIMAGK